MAILDPDIQQASANLIAAHKRVVKAKNRQISELQANNGALQRELQGQPLTPSEALVERAEKAEEELREARIALSSWEYNVEQRLDHAMKEAVGELAGRLERTETQLRVLRERAYARQREATEAKARAEKAEQELDRFSAMHAQQVKTIAELQRELGLTRPDWVAAPAVLARRESQMDAQPQVWANVGRDVWESGTLRAHTQFLRGVTPLYPEGS